MHNFGLLLDLPPEDTDSALIRLSLAAKLEAVSDGGPLLLTDGHDLPAAITRVEQAGGHVAAVRELPTDTTAVGPHRRVAKTFTALLAARAAMRRTPELRMLWNGYAP